MMQEFDLSNLSKILLKNYKEIDLKKDEKYQLLCLLDDLILVWCKKESCLLAQIVQNISIKSENELSKKEHKIQKLILSKPPFWEVKHIVLNKNGTGILIIGNEGIAVVELPKRWGNPSLFEGGSDTVTCRVEYVGEQFFMFNPLVKIISAEWHPGSLNQTFVIVLSSDNYLRIYSLSYLDISDQAISFASTTTYNNEGGKFGVGETAVDFGIGHPICVNKEISSSLSDSNIKSSDEIDNQVQNYQDFLWPVFILFNNGDVYYVVISLNKRSLKNRKIVYGPLSFLPASFDNYGVDFCSLLVLPSTPTVLVIASTKGLMHHCIVMDTSETDEEMEEQMESLSRSVSQIHLQTPKVYLHIYESVQLILSFASSTSKFASSLALINDPSTPARYLISHNEGLHCISLPLIERLLTKEASFLESDLECHAEHLLSTRSVASAEPCPLVGSSVSVYGKIYLLLSSGYLQILTLPSILTPTIPLFDAERYDIENSLPKKNQMESFEEHIRFVLRRASSQPLLLSGSGGNFVPEEFLNLYNRVTKVLRESYIQQQIKAREDIKRRHKILIEQQEHLRKAVSTLDKEKSILTDKAHQLAEKYEETSDKHFQIMKRLEMIIGNLVRKMPILSTSERGMLKELEEISEKRKTLQIHLEQIHSKSQWEFGQIENEKLSETTKNKKTLSSSFSDNQLTCLRSSLGKEGDKLSTLVKNINHLKRDLWN